MFTKESLRKLIIPLILEQVLAVTVGMFDVVMVSSVGEAAISGVSLVDMINNLIIAIFAALATGGAVVTAQYIGGKRNDEACKSAKQILLIALTISTTLMLLCVFAKRSILSLLFGAIEDKVMSSALIYFKITALSFPFLAIYNASAALFRAMGDSKLPMKVSILMNIINVTGNAICIYGLGFGVEGVAIPSFVSRAVAALIMFVLLCNKDNVVHLEGKSVRPDFLMIKKILYIGIPSGIESGLFQFGRIIVVSIIAGFGTVQIAANGVANTIDGMGCIAGQAMSLAIITVVGQCVGARDEQQVRFYTKKLVKITYAITAVVNSCILLSLPLILKLFTLSPETETLAYILILIHNGMAMLLWPSAFTLPNALRACNDVKFAMYLSVFSMFMFRILFSYILGVGLGMGAIGVWLAMVMDWIFRASLFIWRFASGKWKKHAGFEIA